jgi:hypothetical protein
MGGCGDASRSLFSLSCWQVVAARSVGRREPLARGRCLGRDRGWTQPPAHFLQLGSDTTLTCGTDGFLRTGLFSQARTQA